MIKFLNVATGHADKRCLISASSAKNGIKHTKHFHYTKRYTENKTHVLQSTKRYIIEKFHVLSNKTCMCLFLAATIHHENIILKMLTVFLG
jgi:hypothetical protein